MLIMQKNTKEANQKFQHETGITLIALVITVIIILILAGITISSVFGENGVIKKAQETKIMTELSICKEELEMFKLSKSLENSEFRGESIIAGETSLVYNTQQEGANENIYDVITSLKDSSVAGKMEIIKGELLINSQDMTEISVAQQLEIRVNPYKIENGVLLSSNTNLALMDSAGTLTIPERVIAIGEGAFSGLSGLKTIIIPGTVKEIGADAFAYNADLETVIMEDGVEIIGNRAFQSCKNLKTVEMPNSIKQLGFYTFHADSNLSNVTLSNNLDIIPSYCFKTTGLKEINIPEGVTELQGSSFANCSNLTTVNIPSTVTTIADTAFNDDKNLINVSISEENKNFSFSNGILLGDNGTTIKIILASALTGSTFTVPDGIEILSGSILSLYSNIKSLKIPSSVTSLSATFISEYITNVEIAPGNTTYETDGKAIYKVGRNTLVRYYGSDTDVQLMDSEISAIGSNAFQDKNITNITLPDSLVSIGSSSFYDCNKLQNLSIGPNVTYIGNYFIYGSAVENITIDSENRNYSIINGALCNYDGTVFINPVKPLGTITSYEIPYGITEISDYAFHGQAKLTDIAIPNTITKIGKSFNYCSSLTKIEIPSSVNEISSSAFANSSNLSEILIHKSAGDIAGAPWGAAKGDKVVKWLVE